MNMNLNFNFACVHFTNVFMGKMIELLLDSMTFLDREFLKQTGFLILHLSISPQHTLYLWTIEKFTSRGQFYKHSC